MFTFAAPSSHGWPVTMEATTIMWRTSSEELPLILKAVEQSIIRMENKAGVMSGHMDAAALDPDYKPMLDIYHQLLRHL